MPLAQVNNEGFLLEGRTMVSNSLTDPEILEQLKVYGYDEARINAGLTLLEETEALILKQKKEYGEQYQATLDVEKAKEAADSAYMKTLKIARLVFQKNAKAATMLMLLGERARSLQGWLEQAQTFYKSLIADSSLVAEMGKFNYTVDKLNEENALVSEVSKKIQAQRKETGEAQQATQDRDAKVKELDKWLSDFRAIIKIALDETPQRMEKLGIQVLNAPRAKKAAVTATAKS